MVISTALVSGMSSLGLSPDLCSWATHFYSHSASFLQMGTCELNAGNNPVMDQHPIQGEKKYS